MGHVLVIEDDRRLAWSMAKALLFAGASSVETVDSEAAAVIAAESRLPDIIVSDVDLKQGGRGPNAVAYIHAQHGMIPAIFVTGNPEDEQACELAMIMLAKPVTTEKLASVFRMVRKSHHDWLNTIGRS